MWNLLCNLNNPQLHSDRVKILMFSFLEFSDYFYYTECVTIFGRVYRWRVMSWVLYGLLYGECPLETTCICIAIMDINRETTVQCFYEKQGVAISQINKKNKENSWNTPHSLHTNNIHCTSSPTSVPSSAIVVCLAAIAAMIFRFPSPIWMYIF